MPYRRLPNTDKARLRAIEAALDKGKIIPTHQLAFSYLSLIELQELYPLLSGANLKRNRAKEAQFSNSKEYADIYRKAKLYVSHFMHVLNFAIAREELSAEVRSYYGLKVEMKQTPLLTREEHIFKWGRKLIDGDAKRIADGGNPIYNPSIAMVRVHYERFEEAYLRKQKLQEQTVLASEQMLQYRTQADEMILKVWNEIEAHFEDLPECEKRDRAADYGITYVYRPQERARAEAERNQTKISF